MKMLKHWTRQSEKYAFAAGLASVLIVFFSMASITAISNPLLKTADETLHLDYAWQVAHGSLPSFTEGVRYDTHLAYTPPVQWVWQHPPLFYTLIAPVVGIASSTTNAENVVIYGRVATSILGTLSVAATLAFVYLSLPDKKYRLTATVVSGLLVPLSTILVGVSAAIYNDTISLALSALALGFTAYMLKTRRLGAKQFILLGALLGLGMLSRSAFAITVIVTLGTLILDAFLKNRAAVRQYLYAIAAGVIALLASGGFYLRNYELSGNILGRSPLIDYVPQIVEGRTKTSIVDQLISYDFWSVVGSILGGRHMILTLVFLALFGLYALQLIYKTVRSRTVTSNTLITFMLLIFAVLQILSAAYYMSGGGGYHVRYLIPLLLPISYFAAYYVMHVKVKTIYLILGLGATYLLSLYLYLRDLSAQYLGDSETLRDTTMSELLKRGLEANKVDRTYLVGLLLSLILIFSMVALVSLLSLRRRQS